jgi:hypothetical protein
VRASPGRCCKNAAGAETVGAANSCLESGSNLKENKWVTIIPLSRDINRAIRSMDWDDYFRQQSVMYRQLAEQTEDAFIKQELLELAAVCEEVANNIEDRLASG